MIRSQLRSLSLSATAAATLLCVAVPAFAQDQPPPSATAVPPPMQAMAAPKGSEDMTGSIGFGVGVTAGAQTLIAPNANIALKYWLSDVLAVVPAFNFSLVKPAPSGSPTIWNFNPEAVVLFVPFRSTSTRLSLGGGLGIGLGKVAPSVGNPNPNTSVHIYVPIQIGVEHFFTRWFSMGIAARSNLIDYNKDDAFSLAITTSSNNLGAVGQLFFYTD